MTITLTINGTKVDLECRPHDSLRTVLRKAGYHSVRFGSETGETGAAAVLVDGKLITADLMLAAQADGHEIETVEGLSSPGNLHPIQEAFIETGAIQSGYSTPAMILAAKALIGRNPNPSEDEVRDALSGILDRETGYLRPVHAVLRAAAVMRGETPESVDVVFLEPLTNADQPHTSVPDASPIAPRVVPSPDVPETRIVGKRETKVDALKLAKGNPAFTDDIEAARACCTPRSSTARMPTPASSTSTTAAARALPGVHAVLHHGNTPAGRSTHRAASRGPTRTPTTR